MNDIENRDDNGQVTENRIDLFFTPCKLPEDNLKGYHAIVIDVLRAATSIIMALHHGAKYVIPVATIEGAIDLASQLPRDDVFLCGEREGKLIEGFDLGNSPTDYTREKVRARRLIFGSTNGSPTLIKASAARSVFLCGFTNLNAVIDATLKLKNPFPLAILCAGKHSRFAIEDAVCGGLFIQRMLKQLSEKVVLNDAAQAADLIARKRGSNILQLLRNCDHGRYLREIGMEEDLSHCAADSTHSVVPVLRDDKLVKLEPDEDDPDSNAAVQTPD